MPQQTSTRQRVAIISVGILSCVLTVVGLAWLTNYETTRDDLFIAVIFALGVAFGAFLTHQSR